MKKALVGYSEAINMSETKEEHLCFYKGEGGSATYVYLVIHRDYSDEHPDPIFTPKAPYSVIDSPPGTYCENRTWFRTYAEAVDEFHRRIGRQVSPPKHERSYTDIRRLSPRNHL